MGTLPTYLLISPLFLAISVFFKLCPPKKINCTYGYRTSLSMKNQETWNEANKYSSDLLLKVVIGLSIIQAISYFYLSEETSVSITIAFMLLGFGGAIICTERKLNQLFDREGNRK